MGGGELKWRLRGGIELVGVAGERRRRSGVWERGMSERARGLGCGGPLDAGARERKSGRALSRAIHGGGEVAAGGAVGARGTGRRAPARGQKSGEGLGRDAWVPRRAGGGRGRP